MKIKFKQLPSREYPAKIIDVHDGDTVTCLIDLGLETIRSESLRLNGINTPELNTAEGKTVAGFLKNLLIDKDVRIVTLKKEKYGRRLAEVWLDDVCVNKLLIEKGFAKEYHGEKRT